MDALDRLIVPREPREGESNSNCAVDQPIPNCAERHRGPPRSTVTVGYLHRLAKTLRLIPNILENPSNHRRPSKSPAASLSGPEGGRPVGGVGQEFISFVVYSVHP